MTLNLFALHIIFVTDLWDALLVQYFLVSTQSAFTCSKLTIETLELWNMFEVNSKNTSLTDKR